MASNIGNEPIKACPWEGLLTKSQVVIAKKLGVPLEEYAKYVKEEA